MQSESATSRALACADLIAEMIKQTQTFPPSDSPLTPLYPKHDRPLLSTLALVSKAFNTLATKALWSRLDSFLPLLNLLSAFDSKETGQNTVPTYVRHRFPTILCLCFAY